MTTYTNGFSCLTNETSNECILEFAQNIPVFNENGEVIDTKREEVASLIMLPETALALASAISNLLADRLESSDGVTKK